MPRQLDPAMKKALSARVNYYREMGIYDFYRRPVEEVEEALRLQWKHSQLKFTKLFRKIVPLCPRPPGLLLNRPLLRCPLLLFL